METLQMDVDYLIKRYLEYPSPRILKCINLIMNAQLIIAIVK